MNKIIYQWKKSASYTFTFLTQFIGGRAVFGLDDYLQNLSNQNKNIHKYILNNK